MKIIKVEAIPITIPFIREAVSSRGKWENDYVVVRITTDDGIVGVGDGGVPKPRSYGESQDSVLGFVVNWFAPRLIGQNPFDMEKIIQLLDETACWQWIAKSAIDYALFDIVGKYLNVPVYKLLGGALHMIKFHWVG